MGRPGWWEHSAYPSTSETNFVPDRLRSKGDPLNPFKKCTRSSQNLHRMQRRGERKDAIGRCRAMIPSADSVLRIPVQSWH